MAREYADPYVYQGTGVLINKANIRDENTFKKVEYQATDFRAAELHKQALPAKFDFDHLKTIHGHLFKDVYDWAGQPRTTDLSKGKTTFERVQNIEATGKRIGNRLQEQNNLQGLDKRQFVEKVSSLYADLNALHPFREGNGRATREFISQVARSAGYEFDNARIDNNKSQWNQASAQSVQGDSGPMKEILSQAIRPSRAVAFEILPREEALKRHPELQQTFKALDTFQKTLPERYPGNQKAQDHFFAQAHTEAVRKLDQGTPTIAPQREPNSLPTGDQKATATERDQLTRVATSGIAEARAQFDQHRQAQTGGGSNTKEGAQAARPVADPALTVKKESKREDLRGASSGIEQTSAYRQSLTAVDDMAKTAGLTTNDPLTFGKSFKGEVIGVFDHHTLLKVSDGVGARHENDTLSRGLKVGERVKLDLDPARELARGAKGIEEKSADIQMNMSSGLGK